MEDPATPRKARGWPLFAISVLVLLLAGFLFLKIRRKIDEPVVVKKPAPVGEASAGRGGPPPTGDALLEPSLKELRSAIDAKRWDEASAALEACRKIRPDAPELKGMEEAIAEGRKAEEAARAAALRKAEAGRKMEREWALAKEKIEKDRRESFWDAALGSLEEFATKYPEIRHDSDFEHELDQVRTLQTEADGYFKKDMEEAQKLLSKEQFSLAYIKADSAFKYYPERKSLAQALQAKIQKLQIQRTMVRIPSTPCWIGSEDHPNEKPLRQVKLPAFLIDRYMVTNEEYYAFAVTTNRSTPLHWGPPRKPPKGHDRHPVVFVTWEDAQAYAQWAGKRLPTSEEWEVAARGPDKREYPWGNTFLEREESYPCNCLEYWQVHKSLSPGTTPVDAKEFDNGQSAFGVFGMGGNVWEWTATAAPAKGENPPPEFRVLKGGSFMTPQKATRCAKIFAEDPRLPHPDVGFRCARDVD